VYVSVRHMLLTLTWSCPYGWSSHSGTSTFLFSTSAKSGTTSSANSSSDSTITCKPVSHTVCHFVIITINQSINTNQYRMHPCSATYSKARSIPLCKKLITLYTTTSLLQQAEKISTLTGVSNYITLCYTHKHCTINSIVRRERIFCPVKQLKMIKIH